MGCGVKLIYYMQKFIIGRDIRHRFTIMCKADIAFGVYDAVQGHTSQLEKVNFLPVGPRHRMSRVGKSYEWNFFVPPVLLEHRQLVWSNRQDFRSVVGKQPISIPQARQLRATVWSHKAAQEREHNRLAAKLR